MTVEDRHQTVGQNSEYQRYCCVVSDDPRNRVDDALTSYLLEKSRIER
jgi:hypothetical protein